MPLPGDEKGHPYRGGGGSNAGGEEEFACAFCGEPIKRYPRHLPSCEDAPSEVRP